MSELNKETVINTLKNVYDLKSKKNIIEMDMVKALIVNDNNIGFQLSSPSLTIDDAQKIKQSCIKAIGSIKGVNSLKVLTDFEKLNAEPQISSKASKKPKHSLPSVKKIILVASGKGGVGKSTTAVSIALSLKSLGYKTGIVDADIYGPSIPTMLGINQKPKIDKQNKMVPIEKDGLQSISIGYVVDQEKATIWRGPMATKALYQLLMGTSWNNLDYLVVDMPPGTGDIQLSIADNFVIDGAVIISTPQKVALADVTKAVNMFSQVNIPIVGIVENMSFIENSSNTNENQGSKNYIFGKGETDKFAKKAHIEFLGHIPLIANLSQQLDSGNHNELSYYQDITKKIVENLA